MGSGKMKKAQKSIQQQVRMIPWNLLLQFIIYNFLPNGQGGLGTLDTNDFGVEGPI
jgi:hypothetical protein